MKETKLDKIYTKIGNVETDVAVMKTNIENIKENVIKQNGSVATHAEAIIKINTRINKIVNIREGKNKTIAWVMTLIAFTATFFHNSILKVFGR